jgi:hypothetical protein
MESRGAGTLTGGVRFWSMAHSLIDPHRHSLLLALLLAGWAVPAVSFAQVPKGSPPADAGTGPGTKPATAGSSRPDSSPDWAGAREGDFVEYSFVAHHPKLPEGTARLSLRLEVLSADAKEVRVALRAGPEAPALLARGLLFAMRRASAPEEQPEAPSTVFGQELTQASERVVVGNAAIVCQRLKEPPTGAAGAPMFSGCAAPGERSLYLGGGTVRYAMSQTDIMNRPYSYSLELTAVGRASPAAGEAPPLAFREGSGYERLSRDPLDTRVEQYTFRTRNGVVQTEAVQWSREEGAERQRGDRVFEGVRLTRMDSSSEETLLEFVYGLVLLSLEEPFPTQGRPAAPKAMKVGTQRVQAWRSLEKWKSAEGEGEHDAMYAWEPWALKDAPVQVRFLPFTSRRSTWPAGNRKEAETYTTRTLRWF